MRMPSCGGGVAFLALWVVVGGLAATHAADDWPEFRGPDGQGHAAQAAPLNWSEDRGLRWKTAVPGRGWSSPVICDGRIWLTTAEETPATAEQLAANRQQQQGNPIAESMGVVARVRLSAVEIDAASGTVLRQIAVFDRAEPPSVHDLNSYASPSPIVEPGRVYCHFGGLGTACIDTRSGEIAWTQQLAVDHGVGPGSSPAAYDRLLIVPCDGKDRQFVAALDKDTGRIVWQTDRPPLRSTVGDTRKAFSTPLTIDVGGRTQVVVPGAQWYAAYDPATGREQWRIDHGDGFSNVPRPIFDGRRLYLCSGFMKPVLWAVEPNAQQPTAEPRLAWKFARQVPTMASPIAVGGRVYLISDAGVAACLDAETGKLLWQERIPGNYSASPMAASGRIYFCSREGVTTVVEAGDAFRKVAENRLEGALMASPAMIDNDLVLRTDSHLYRISGFNP